MDHDSAKGRTANNPKEPGRRKVQPSSEPADLPPDLPPQDAAAQELGSQDLAPQVIAPQVIAPQVLAPQVLAPQGASQVLAADDIDPTTVNAEEDDEARLPEVAEESGEAVAAGPA